MIQMQHGHTDGTDDAGCAERMDGVIKMMRLLADPTRLRVLSMLQQNELNVSAMCDRLDLAQPTVSHHLGLLRTMGLVNTRRDGKQVFYSLNRDNVRASDGGLAVAAGDMQLQLIRTN